jgi:hypothetical protein
MDLHLVLSDHHPINKQLDQMPHLVKGGLLQSELTRWQNDSIPSAIATSSWW